MAICGNPALHFALLAKRLLEKGAAVIDDRGRVFSSENINELLSIRNFVVGLAENGLGAERVAGYGRKDSKAFADSLDRQLAKLRRETPVKPCAGFPAFALCGSLSEESRARCGLRRPHRAPVTESRHGAATT